MFDESKHPRDNDGKFTDKNGESYSDGVNERIKWAKDNGIDLPLNTDGSVDDLKLQELYEGKKFANIIQLPKKEYAELCSSIRTKYSNQIPAVGELLYGNSYFKFRYNKETERIVCELKIPIEGNEELISDIMRGFRDE